MGPSAAEATRTEERVAFEQFIDFVADRRRRHPGAHVYHYASYEETALKRLASWHATREVEVDNLLRQDALVDLYKVVREGIRRCRGCCAVHRRSSLAGRWANPSSRQDKRSWRGAWPRRKRWTRPASMSRGRPGRARRTPVHE